MEAHPRKEYTSKVSQKDRVLRIYLGTIGTQDYDYDLHTALVGSPFDVDQRWRLHYRHIKDRS